MRKLFKQYRLLAWISLILMFGFAAISTTHYFSSREALQKNLSDNGLALTGDIISSQIQNEYQRPMLIARQMAHDSFLKDSILLGEENADAITKYLKAVKVHNNATASYLVSESSQNHYSANGSLGAIQANLARDQWYYRVKSLKLAYEGNAEIDIANRDNLSIVSHHKVLDDDGKLLGAVGIALSLDGIKRLIDSYQSRFGRSIYLIDRKANVLLSSAASGTQSANLNKIAGISQIAKQIVQHNSTESLGMDYATDTGRVFINTRTIPDLGWQLVVAQTLDPELKPVRKSLNITLAIAFAVLVSVLSLVLLNLRRYQQRIEKSAATDNLTKLLNRQAFDFVFRQAVLDSERSRQPLCVALMDIDHFKKINDKYGRLVGDHVLREIALLAKRSLRESDVICRWGGEEFLLLLKNCTLEKATSIAENLRNTIAGNDFSRTTDLAKGRLALTVSMGVAECKSAETEDSVFDRADVALRQAKENGRNSVYFSE